MQLCNSQDCNMYLTKLLFQMYKHKNTKYYCLKFFTLILTSLFDWCSTSQTWNFFWISLIWDTVTLQSVSDSLTSESIKEVRKPGSRWQRLTRVRDNLFSRDVPFPSTILDINISIWESVAEKPNVLWNVKLSKQVKDSLKRASEMCSKLKPSTSKDVCVLHIYEFYHDMAHKSAMSVHNKWKYVTVLRRVWVWT